MLSKYGGVKTVTGAKTGFFHVELIDGKWWFIDPDGCGFFAVGTNRVDYLNTPDKDGVRQYHENIKGKFPTQELWARHIAQRLGGWGFNVMGARPSNAAALYPGWPYYTWCPASHTFARKKKLLTAPGVPGYMTFVDIFDPDWAKNYQQVCQEIAAPGRKDKWLLGYYTDNELFWGVTFGPGRSLLDACLHQDAGTFNKRELVRFMKDRYQGDLAALKVNWQIKLARWDDLLGVKELPAFNEAILADKRAWLFHYARRYFQVVSDTLRRHDPNHLILGCRIHGWVEPEVAWAMGEFIDVISYNKYDGQAPAWQMAEVLHRHSGRPTLLSEWGFRAMDAGLTNTGGVGRIVADQKMRGRRYADFITGLAQSPHCVGSIFYAYVDDPASGGGGMMHNENSNYGMVDIKDRPYADFVKLMAASHRKLVAQHIAGAPATDVITIATPRDYHREPRARFFIQRDGRVVGNDLLRAFLRGPDAGEDCQAFTFDMDFARPVKFVAAVYEAEGAPVIEFMLDGQRAARFPLPAGKGRGHVSYPMPQGWHTVYNKEIGIKIPKGAHTVTVRNTGTGWTWLDGYRVYPAR